MYLITYNPLNLWIFFQKIVDYVDIIVNILILPSIESVFFCG